MLILEGDGLFAPDFLSFFVGEKDVEGVFLGHFVVIFMQLALQISFLLF